jgi:hypothetical protein
MLRSGLSKQGVLNQIEKLEKRGLLSVEHSIGKVNSYTLPVKAVDQSIRLTSQHDGPPPVHAVDRHPSTPLTGPVHAVDRHPSTPLTGPVHAVDPNRKEPEVKPEYEPEFSALRLDPETTKNVPQPKPKVKKQKESDADWMLGLQSSTAYSHVNVAVEYSKAEVWIQQNPGRQCTRKFFLNWLNRAADSQRAMNAPRTPHRVLQEDQKQDPAGWREWLLSHNQPYAPFLHAKSHLKDRFRNERD